MASETNETREKSLNFLEEIIEESIAGGETRIQTRFPPEPNGYLHIGHAKSICINFGLAKKYGGKCNLRFDDTNPVKEDVEYVDSIKRDIQWLGFQWELERYASDYFDQLYEWAVELIKKGLAYVDDQTQDEIRENRGTVSVPGTPSPWRDRSVEENLDLFERMNKGEFEEGRYVLARLNPYTGFVNRDDLSGTPIYLDIKQLEAPEIPKDEKGQEARLPRDGVMYMLPGTAQVSLQWQGRELFSSTTEMAQYGIPFALDPTLFTNKKAPAAAIFNPATGALRSLGEMK